jgi:hypothetical protein
MSSPTRVKYGGFRSLYSREFAGKPPVDGPRIFWVVYGPPDEDGMSERREGYADDHDAAKLSTETLVKELWG